MKLTRAMIALLTLFATAACGGREILIGYSGGLTGSLSELGIDGRKGIELALLEYAADGGARGFRLLVADDSNTAAGGARAVRTLAAAGCRIVIGPMTSAAAAGAIAEAERCGIVLLSPTVAAWSRTNAHQFFFSLFPTARLLGQFLGRWCAEAGALRVTALSDDANRPYADRVIEGFAATHATGGPAFRIAFDSRRGLPLAGFVRAALETGPAALLVVACGADTARICQELAKAGNPLPVYTPPWAMTGELFEQGGRAIERIRSTGVNETDATNPAFVRFRKRYHELFNREPGFASVYAADAMRVALAAFTASPDSGGAALRDLILRIGNFSGLQTRYRINPAGEVMRRLVPLTVRNGYPVKAASR